MSRSRSRETRRRRRLENGLREAVRTAQSADGKGAACAQRTGSPRADNGELWRLLCDIERSNLCVWDIARAVDCSADEMAMIAQAVAPQLAGMTPGKVLGRPKLAK